MNNVLSAARFKARCLAVLDEVASSRCAVIVTKRGKPVAKLVPLERADAKRNVLAGSVIHEDDLVSPAHEVWNGL